MLQQKRWAGGICIALSYLCISDAELLIPRHSNKMMPVTATRSKKRVRVTRFQTTRVGGNCALAAFQLKPPLGRSILGDWDADNAPQPDRKDLQRVYGNQTGSTEYIVCGIGSSRALKNRLLWVVGTRGFGMAIAWTMMMWHKRAMESKADSRKTRIRRRDG